MTEKAIVESTAESPTFVFKGEQNKCYDIFLSFRGEDTRHYFIGYLYNALCQRGFKTFMDDEGLERGQEISVALIKAIEESKVAIVIFSENYASSPWCLNELVKILECKREKGQMVWPIFYKVDPSDVRHQRNSYKEAMAKHENRFKSEIEKVKRWRSALNEAANLSGSTFKTGYEFEFISAIIEEASNKLHRKRLYIGEHIIGLESCLKEVKSLLYIQDDDTVTMLGIHGIGGIGKSTLAKVLYNLIVDHFDCACFLESVRERSISGMGLVNVQEKLLSQIFEKGNFNFGNVDEGAYMIKHRLCNRRVLLVLDDVDKMEQLEKLAGGSDWFGPGSKIIITTRDKHLLRAHGIEKAYVMKELDHNKALELFCWKAFKKSQPDEAYMDISNQIIDHAKGLPLALKVIGSNLFGRNLRAWESALDKYQRIPDKGIQNILRVSYDTLEDDHKTVFLDIACFFKGESLRYVEYILDACDLSPQYNIQVLADKSLIILEYQQGGCHIVRLGMHDLIQDMGKEIVKQDASSKLDQYSRLWNDGDILDVLTTNSGSDNIQVIIFCPNELKKVEWSGTSFAKMNNLRILIIQNVEFSIGPTSLPNNLRVLEWEGYPSEFLPQGFHPRKMVVLKLEKGQIISLEPLQKFEKLTFMDLRGCHQLTKIPDMSGAANLKTLLLEHCTNLKEVHDSVGVLPKLLKLSLEECTNLEIFPRGIQMTSLKWLDLNGCRSLQYFPEILGQMDELERIEAERTGIEQIPHSICYLSGLHRLYLSDNYDLVSFPKTITQLDKLEVLLVKNCRKLQQISEAPPNLRTLGAKGCICLTSQSLDTLWSQLLQALLKRRYTNIFISMPRSHIPNWFDHRCIGGSLSFWVRKEFPEIAFAVVFETLTNKISSKTDAPVEIFGYNNGRLILYEHSHPCSGGGTIFVDRYKDVENFNTHDWHHVEIKFEMSESNCEIDECGVYIYKQDINMEDIRFECPILNNSNMDTIMSTEDAELTDKIEELQPRKRSLTGYMSRNGAKIDEAKARKRPCRVISRNDKLLGPKKSPRRLIQKSRRKRIGVYTSWRRQAFPPLFFSKLFKLSSSFLSI